MHQFTDNHIYTQLPKDFLLTDSHCHLLLSHTQDEDFLPSIEKASTQQNITLLDIGIDPSDWKERVTLTMPYKKNTLSVYHTIGMHPCQSVLYTTDELIKKLELHIEQSVAVGEIGLDWYRMYSPKEKQTELFIAQIELAKHYKKPIIIHARDSIDDIITIIESQKMHLNVNGIMHCFSGTKAQAKKCLDLGFYISFAGNLSYKSAEALQEVVRIIPDNAILTETDSPYLLHRNTQQYFKKISKENKNSENISAHIKKRYSKVNTPLYLFFLYQTLATIKNITIYEIATLARKNLHKVIFN